jgi:hypothetical protein
MSSRRLPMEDLLPHPVGAWGALDFDRRGNGISPRRLPAWTRPQVPELMDVVVRMPSGVRLRFATDAHRLGVEFLATNLVTPPAPRRPIVFNLESGAGLRTARSDAGNTIVLNSARPGDVTMHRGDPDTLWFDDLPGTLTDFELWLPHNAFLELRALHLDADAVLAPAAAEIRPRWIHYGSSISHCMEAIEPAQTWPAVAARRAGLALQNLGFGGQCHLDQFVARTIRDAPADVVTLKAGINIINMDSMRERVFAPALHGFLDTVREGKPKTPIVVISPIFCPSAETCPGPTVPDGNGRFVTLPGFPEIRAGCLSLVRVRELISDVVERRRSAGDVNLHYVDGLTLFGADDAGDLPDDLHPNPAGYVRMGERFAPRLAGMIDA